MFSYRLANTNERDKNDTADAERAARDAPGGKAPGAPKAGDGWVEALRFRTVARDAAVGQSTRAANSAHAPVVTALAPTRWWTGTTGPLPRRLQLASIPRTPST